MAGRVVTEVDVLADWHGDRFAVRRPVGWLGVWVGVALLVNAAAVASLLTTYRPQAVPLELSFPSADGGTVDPTPAADGQMVVQLPLQSNGGVPSGKVTVEFDVDGERHPPHTFAEGQYTLPVPLASATPGTRKVTLAAPRGCLLGLRSTTVTVGEPGEIGFADTTGELRVGLGMSFEGAKVVGRGTVRGGQYKVSSGSGEPFVGNLEGAAGGWSVPASALASADRTRVHTITLLPPAGGRVQDGRGRLAVKFEQPPPCVVTAFTAPKEVSDSENSVTFTASLSEPAPEAFTLTLIPTAPSGVTDVKGPVNVPVERTARTAVYTLPLKADRNKSTPSTLTATLTVPPAYAGGTESRSADVRLLAAPPPTGPTRLTVTLLGDTVLPTHDPTKGTKVVVSVDVPAVADEAISLTFKPTVDGEKEVSDFRRHIPKDDVPPATDERYTVSGTAAENPNVVVIKKGEKRAEVTVSPARSPTPRLYSDRKLAVTASSPNIKEPAKSDPIAFTSRAGGKRKTVVIALHPIDGALNDRGDKSSKGWSEFLTEWSKHAACGQDSWSLAVSVGATVKDKALEPKMGWLDPTKPVAGPLPELPATDGTRSPQFDDLIGLAMDSCVKVFGGLTDTEVLEYSVVVVLPAPPPGRTQEPNLTKVQRDMLGALHGRVVLFWWGRDTPRENATPEKDGDEGHANACMKWLAPLLEQGAWAGEKTKGQGRIYFLEAAADKAAKKVAKLLTDPDLDLLKSKPPK